MSAGIVQGVVMFMLTIVMLLIFIRVSERKPK